MNMEGVFPELDMIQAIEKALHTRNPKEAKKK